jgi:tripartite-type tricarboxylate transporter receptor subunit TctC
MQARLLAALAAALCTVVSFAAAAQDYPRRAVTVVVPFAAGGVTDQVARLVSAKVADNVGHPVVIENRPGGGGQIAAGAVKQAQPDGTTLLLGDVGTHAINATLYSKLTYDPAKDFVPVTEFVEMPHVLVVPADSPFQTFAELVAAARARPGSLTYASVGVGSGAHLLGEMLKAEYKLDMVHAPYRGSSQITPDLLANRVGFFFGAVASMAPLITDGKLRALMITDKQRSALLPSVPSAPEVGMASLDLKVWFGILAPVGTPGLVINALNAEFVKALRHPDVSARLKAWGANIVASSPKEFADVIAADGIRLGKIVKSAGARVD